MQLTIKKVFFLFSVLFLSSFLFQQCQPKATETGDPLAWPDATSTTKPWTRWWWMGSAVDTTNLNWQLEEMAKAGIGGVEISPIYGVKGFEDQFIDHLSPQWLNMINHTVNKARELDMEVDMILGTGWPFGGPQIEPEMAASRLLVQKYTLTSGNQFKATIQAEDEQQRQTATLEAILAYSDTGQMMNLTDLIDKNGQLSWQPEEGTWEIFALFCGKTRQRVKRPAPGGEGWVMDHFSEKALKAYLAPYEKTLPTLENPPRAIFNDSYEVVRADWTPAFFNAFAEKRGYDLTPFIPYLLSEENNDTVARLKSDFRETLSDLLLYNFTEPWAAWAHENGFQVKNQAHGSPGNLLDLYAAADIPECESFSATPFDIPGLRRDTTKTQWEDPDPIMLKFASSAAHIAGRPLTSAESMTWLGDHFKVSLSQCKPEMEQLFLSGINHIFFHGTTYSPQNEPWPGWKFYAATHLAPHNTIWRDAPAFFSYINRVQSVMQNSTPDNELLVYWPVYDVWGDAKHTSPLQQLTVHHISEWLLPSSFYQLVKKLTNAGYSIDFISDQQLMEATAGPNGIKLPGGQYKALVLPDCERMPVTTFQRFLDLADQGADVLLVDLPEDVPGWHQRESRSRKLQTLKNSLNNLPAEQKNGPISWGRGKVFHTDNITKTLPLADITPEKVVDFGLKFIRQKWENGYYYYFVNHTAETVQDYIPLNTALQSALLMDPQSGQTGLASLKREKGITSVRLQLHPGEAMIVRTFSNQKINSPNWIYETNEHSPIAINGEWTIKFLEGGPKIPPTLQKNSLSSWTEWSEDAADFSGTALYSISIPRPQITANEYILDLGLVRESARVFLNGKKIGTAWSIPYRLRIEADHLREGDNQLDIEVTNLGANRIRYMDQKGIEWKKFYDTNVVHISYQPFDASGWPDMPSGLLGPVRVIAAGSSVGTRTGQLNN